VLPRDINLADYRYGGEPGVLTVRAEGNLLINSNLSDGFSHATPCTTATCNATSPSPATVLADESWSYRLVAGADANAASPLAVIRNTSGGNVTLAAGKLIRTGTGDIQVRAGGNIALADNKSAIYTAGRASPVIAGFTSPSDAQFSQGGGDVSLAALGDIASPKRSLQLYSNWLFRQGKLDSTRTAYETDLQTAWWVRFDQFQQGVGALGGGDVSLVAGGKVENVSASTPTQARMASATPDANALVKTGGGTLRVETGGDVLGGQYYADNGELVIRVGGKLDGGQKVGTGTSAKPLYTILALGDAQARVRARDDVNIHALINPHLVSQSQGAGTNTNITGTDDPKWSLFSTYGENSGLALASLSGTTRFHNATGSVATFASAYPTSIKTSAKYNIALLSILPPNLETVAFQGDAFLEGKIYLSPAPKADLAILAANHVSIPSTLTMSDAARLPDPVLPGEAGSPGSGSDQFFNAASLDNKLAHALTPVHVGDTEPVRIYAVAGNVSGKSNTFSLKLPKAVRVRAGQDVNDLSVEVQHVDAGDVSRIEAGRDLRFDSGLGSRSPNARIWVAGPGRLEVTAGRDIDLGASAGVVSRSNLDNTALPDAGADIHLAAGVGKNGIDYAGTVDRLATRLASGEVDDTSLWLARWLTGDDSLNETNALAEVRAIDALDTERQRVRVREMLYTALRTTGRDSLNQDSAYAADYARGYAALELAFPGIGDRDASGEFTRYQGGINLFASRVKTERGGNIEFMIPGGSLVVGLSNTPEQITDISKVINPKDKGALGMVTVSGGSIKGFARDDVLVNQSRILTVGGGDILLWSSEGDIDAGKGKKTAATVPPPIIKVDKDGNVTLELQGAATGSGIGALKPVGGIAGDVDLIAPKGTVNAGDAGIRAGNLNIAAAVVLGADNISVSGTSTGTPVADTSAVTAASSGATNADGGTAAATAALSSNLADAARSAEELKQSFKPTFITAEVVGHGE
jgi:hypothetical protein